MSFPEKYCIDPSGLELFLNTAFSPTPFASLTTEKIRARQTVFPVGRRNPRTGDVVSGSVFYRLDSSRTRSAPAARDGNGLPAPTVSVLRQDHLPRFRR